MHLLTVNDLQEVKLINRKLIPCNNLKIGRPLQTLQSGMTCPKNQGHRLMRSPLPHSFGLERLLSTGLVGNPTQPCQDLTGEKMEKPTELGEVEGFAGSATYILIVCVPHLKATSHTSQEP